jgi:hypothetical protein
MLEVGDLKTTIFALVHTKAVQIVTDGREGFEPGLVRRGWRCQAQA